MAHSKTKKLAALASTTIIATALVAGCSSSNSSGGSATTSNPTPTGPAPTVKTDQALATKVPEGIKSSGVLSVATSPGSAPMVFGDISDPQGVDPDLARAVATTLGLKASFTDVPFDQIQNNVAGGSSDVGWSVITVTNERLQLVNFATYYNSGKAWVVKKGSSFNPDNYCGTKIASIQGYLYTTQANDASIACTKIGKPSITIKIVQSAAEGQQAVTSGDVDAFPVDSPIAESMIATSNGSLAQAGKTTQIAPLGAVVQKNAGLGPLVQQAIQKLINGGQYKQILDRWQVPTGAITQSKLETTKVTK